MRTLTRVAGVALVFVVLAMGLTMVLQQRTMVLQQRQILMNQRAQMKQQLHSDAIALASLLGDEGMRKLYDPNTQLKDLSEKESFAIGLLIQRLMVAYYIRDAFTPEEWEKVVEDGRAVMQIPLVRQLWAEVKDFYPKPIQEFIDQFVGKSE